MVFAILFIIDFAWEDSLYVEMGFRLPQFIHNINTMYIKSTCIWRKGINHLHVLGNMKVYLHFLSFLYNQVSQVV